MAQQTTDNRNNREDFADDTVKYSDGEIAILDKVKDPHMLRPAKPLTNVIALVCSGSMSIDINGKQQEVSVGNILLLPPTMKTSNSHCTDDFECKALCLSDHVIQQLIRDKLDIWHDAVYMSQANVLRMSESCKEDFIFYYALIRSKTGTSSTAPASNEIIKALIRVLLLELCSKLEHLSGMEREKVSQGKLLFNKYLSLISNSEVKRQPVAFYASQLAITPKYLTMLCLKYSNKTASDWIIQYTIEDIRYYLKNTSLSIKEISAKLGFANMSHFGSYVRKHFGISPTELRSEA